MKKNTILIFSILIYVSCVGQNQIINTRFMQHLDSIKKSNQLSRGSVNYSNPLFLQKIFNKKTSPEKTIPSVNKILNIASCNDTSARFSLGTDIGDFYVYDAIKTRDGNLLVSGEFYNYYDPIYKVKGYLLKCDFYGNVIWSKFYSCIDQSSATNYLYLSKIAELKDGSILITGGSQNILNTNNDFIVAKTDGLGNLIWTKNLYSRLWKAGNNNFFIVQQMKEDPFNGDVYITGVTSGEGINLIKINVNSGNIPWSAIYKLNANGYNNEKVAGIDIRANEVIIVGTQTINYTDLLYYKINKLNGDTLQTKMLKLLDEPYYKFGFILADELQILNNGDIAFCGKQFGQNQSSSNPAEPLYQGGVVIMDSNFNFRNGYCFRNTIETNYSTSHITMHPDGSGLFAMITGSGYSGNTYYTEFKDGVILKQRVKSFYNEGYPSENRAIQFDNDANLLVQVVGDSIKYNSKIIFTKLHLSDTSSTCLGQQTDATFIQPLHFANDGYAYFDSTRKSIFLPSPTKTLFQDSFNLAKPVPLCTQTSMCDTLKLLSNMDTTCIQTPIIIHCKKNPSCGSPVQFNYDTTAVQSFTWQNDSTYQIQFRSAWHGYIKGTLAGCSLYNDSILITVLNAPSILQLGTDTTICPGNQIVLNAHSGYATYLWQDGSTDSVYNIKQAGAYFVTTTTACGDHFSDTIIVINHPPILFNLGNDISICYKDTATIKAPDDFINYQWSPAYNISQINSITVNVSPAVDTNYTVRAEKAPGCFVYDTIRVKVKSATLVYLGNDTSFCNGESKVLNAGNGFDKYLWSNGSTAQQIIAYTKGDYYLIATNNAGCKSYDTVRILNVWANPILTLDHNPVLCIGTSRILDAGKYSAYVWQDNSASSTFVVSGTGIYYVTITDVHQCHGSDTVKIISLIANPANFLPADTILCSYEKMVLSTNQLYSAYLWSNGYTSSSITVSKAGQYWLQATNQFNCTGKDSITILPKECLTGLYVPKAFTPNYDGKNDVFKPLIFGNVVKFEWSIYNRYGQIIFRTNDTTKGWDGSVNGILQNAAGFVWYCRFQFSGEMEQTKQGNFLLLK